MAVNVAAPPSVIGFALLTKLVVVLTFTVCVNTADVDAALFASPLYTAVIGCVPAASAAVENDAVPPERVAVFNTVVPSKNWTVPVAAAGLTAALNVTDAPAIDGFDDDVTVVVVVS